MAIWTQDSIFINCLGSTLMISNIMQYRVTNKYGWTTLKFLNVLPLAADLRFATATNNGMNTYEIGSKADQVSFKAHLPGLGLG